MSDLVFIAFDNEKQAEEVRDKVLEMQREYLIEVDDAVVEMRIGSPQSRAVAASLGLVGCSQAQVGRRHD